jgi:hypothetical protein
MIMQTVFFKLSALKKSWGRTWDAKDLVEALL